MADAITAPVARSLITKLSEVQASIARVPKRGHNTHFNYDFATESDISEAIRLGLAERHLMLVPSVRSVEWRTIATKAGQAAVACVSLDVTVYDGDSSAQLTFTSMGEGQDSGDKCIPKAITSAVKYACLKLFLIPTGDDPERDDASPLPNEAPRVTTPAHAVDVTEAAALAPASTTATLVTNVDKKSGTAASGREWTLYVVSLSTGQSGSTFDADIGELAIRLWRDSVPVSAAFGPGAKRGQSKLLALTPTDEVVF